MNINHFSYLCHKWVLKKLWIMGLCLLLSVMPELCFAMEHPLANTDVLTVSFKKIPVRSLLQLLAERYHFDVMMSDQVSGELSLHVQRIPLKNLLDLIFKTQGLAYRQLGAVLWVGAADELFLRDKQSLQIQLQQAELAPLQAQAFRISDGKAADLLPLLKLSTRGTATVDARTNTLWVHDRADKLEEVAAWVKQIDVPVKQILIEARIVNVDHKFEQDFGMKLGLLNKTSPAPSNRFSLALPASTASGELPASLGLAFMHLGHGLSLDMELSALESAGHGRVISSPRVVTANQQAAIIQSGQDIPYQEKTTSGATSVAFKKAVLSLKVVPQITSHHQLILELTVNQDKRGSKEQEVSGVPVINTRQLETHVVVNDGQTVVLGGIYEQVDDQLRSQIPLLGSLPGLGTLFSKIQKSNEQNELLIFITPTILP